MDRNRFAAFVATMGDHPHKPLFDGVLKELDAITSDRDGWREHALRLEGDLGRTLGALSAAEADADRLAAHIVKHPVGDHQSVLTLHDRSKS